MKARDMRAVIDGLQRKHGLLAAYLEATDKIDWRALHQGAVIAETPKVPSTSPFVFRRANLVPVPAHRPGAAGALDCAKVSHKSKERAVDKIAAFAGVS
jgi:hypothetical protein